MQKKFRKMRWEEPRNLNDIPDLVDLEPVPHHPVTQLPQLVGSGNARSPRNIAPGRETWYLAFKIASGKRELGQILLASMS